MNCQYLRSMKALILILSILPLTVFSQIDGEWHSSFAVMGQATLLDLTVASGSDIQVPTESNIASFEKNISKKPINHSKTIIFPGLNHLFQQCERCKVEESVN